MNNNKEIYGLGYNITDTIEFTISIDTLGRFEDAIKFNFCFYQTHTDSMQIKWDNRVFDLVIDYSKNTNKLYIEYDDVSLVYDRKLVPPNVGIWEIFIVEPHQAYSKNQEGELKINYTYLNNINLVKKEKYCFDEYLNENLLPQNVLFRLVYRSKELYLISNWVELKL